MRFLRLKAIVAGLLTAALLVLSPTLGAVAKPLLGSSATYAPGLIATFGVAFSVPLAGRGSVPRLLVAAGTIFLLLWSLEFWTLRSACCLPVRMRSQNPVRHLIYSDVILPKLVPGLYPVNQAFDLLPVL